MKKMLGSLCIIVLSVLLFFACGGGDDGNGTNDKGSIKGVILMESASSGTSRIAFAPPDWAPAYGARVKLECKDKKAEIEPCEHESETKEDGSFVIEDIVPGEYNMTAETVLEDGTKKKSFDEVNVEANKVKDVGEVEIKDVGVLYGLVKLSDGGDPLGASCFIPGTTMVAMAETSGAYGINDVAEGDYSVSCCKALYKCKTVGGISVLAGQATMISDMTLEREAIDTPLGTVGGVVTDSDSGTYLAGVVITADPDEEGENPQTTQTNSEGEYTLSLVPGDYTLILSRESYEGYQTNITVVVNATQELNFTLALNAGVQKGKISGTVKDQAGAAIASAVVVTNPATESKFTDNTGHFQILNVLPGNYTVTASKGGYLSKSANVSLAGSQELTLAIILDPACADADGDGYTSSSCGGLDCNDSNKDINPGVTENNALCNAKDDDCDGTVDEGCTCTTGATKQCGATETGECAYGTQTCTNGTWAACVGSIEPATEVCSDSKDNDCDGKTDSTDEDCFACTPGSTQQCGSTDVGECSYGTKTCVSGFWGTCVGAVDPVTEICSDSKDNDCDGTSDEGCAPPATATNEYAVDSNTRCLVHFNEGSGTITNDETSNNYDGNLLDAVPWNSNTPFGSGSAVNLDGTNDRVQFNSPVIQNMASGTVEFWVYPTKDPSTGLQTFIQKVGSGGSRKDILIEYLSNKKISVSLGNFTQESTTIIPVNKWTHVAVTWDGSFQKIYINGKLDKSSSTTATIPDYTDGIYLGVGYGEANRYQGMFDEFRVSNIARTSFQSQEAYIPAGCFNMGDSSNSCGSSDECPVHNVCLSSFKINVYEVTNVQYKTCVDSAVCTAPGNTSSSTHSPYYGSSTYDNYPVIYVNWAQAKAYCEWVGGRLPTEAEWEYAARGGLAGKRFPWGDDAPICTLGTTNGAQGDACSPDDTIAVGSFLANGYGLYDMAGNVREWTNDWYAADYYSSSPTNDPTGPTSGTLHILRGGNWADANQMHVAGRAGGTPTAQDNFNGFRCAK